MRIRCMPGPFSPLDGSARKRTWVIRDEKFSVPSRKPGEIRQGCASANMSSSGNSNPGEPPPKRLKEDVEGEYIVVCEINSPAFRPCLVDHFPDFYPTSPTPSTSISASLARARLSRTKERVWSNCILPYYVSCKLAKKSLAC